VPANSAYWKERIGTMMHRFKVWAPRARRVEVQLAGRQFPLAKEAAEQTGWWSATIDTIDTINTINTQAGDVDYAYLLDEDPTPLPDPRSAWQPYGVHGPSRLLDHSRFQWSDANWQAPPLSSAVLYELHIGTFTPEGTFDAAIGRLDDLVDLGVTHIEILPVASFPGRRGWGYDGVDLFAPQESYGGPEGLKRLVDACHNRNLAVLLDVVYNHFGPVGNYLQRFGPYLTPSHITPWGDAVNLEQAGSTEVRRFFCDNALMWLREYHFDGLRLDAVHAFIDRSAVSFLEQLATEVQQLQASLGRSLVLIAESDLNDPRLVSAQEAGGYGLDAQWSDDFHHALVTVLTGETAGYYQDFGSLADLATALREVFVYSGRYSSYRQQRHGRPVGPLPRGRFLGYAQNHDQVGNRPRGERLGHLTTPGRARIAAALVLTSPFVPLLFQGEEFDASAPFLYFTDHEDKELGRKIDEGRSKELSAFGWEIAGILPPQSEEAFERSRLDWSERDREPHASMLAWYKALIHLRRNTPELTDGRANQIKVSFNEDARWLRIERGPITIACNLGSRILMREAAPGARLLLASDPGVRLAEDRISLPPDTVAILARE